MNARTATALLAEFGDADALLAAARAARAQGHVDIEAYAPHPVEGLADALGATRDAIAPAMLCGGLLGGGGTFALECWSAVFAYPVNVGGRPLFSWPAFLPAAIEMCLLGAALAGVAAMLVGNGLPRLHHPLFEVEGFERASDDRYFLLLPATDAAARHMLERQAALTIREVAA